MKKLISIILCGALMIMLIPSNAVAASKPTVTKKMIINVGQSKTIKVTGKCVKSKIFKSNKKSVATVTKKGKVTGKKMGTAKITVTVKYKKTKKSKKITTKKYTCTVTVNVRKAPVPTNKPVITKKPNVTQKPSVTERPKATPEPPKDSSGPQNTEVPSVTNEPQNTPDVPVATEPPVSSETPQSTEVPSVTNEPQNTPNVPSVTENPSVTEKPEPSVRPSLTPEAKKYDYTFLGKKTNIGIVWAQYPSTTQKGIYEWYNADTGELKGSLEVPVLDDIETIDGNDYGVVIEKPTCVSVGYKRYYNLNNGKYSDLQEIPATGHTSDEIWHTSVDSNGETGRIWNECKKCGSHLSDIYVMFKQNNYAYGSWIQEPSETQDGILAIYKGVGIKGMSKEELAEKYDSYDVVFADGTKDTYYGDIVYKDNGEIQRFDVYAKSTAQMTGTITYPKYEIKEIDLGNGETTKVYGYYDTVMADELYKLLNEYRVENGLEKLGTNDYMKSLADKRAPEELYVNRYNAEHGGNVFAAHERPNGTMCWTIVGENGNLTYGENAVEDIIIPEEFVDGLIQKTEYTAQEIMQYIRDSREHDANMLNPDYGGVGISVFVGYPQNKDGTFQSCKYANIVQSFMY